NSPKRLGKDAKGNTIVHPPVSLDEHVAVQKENKVRTLLLQALPEDHMPDFHYYDDARDIWMAVKARFGGNEESKKMRNITCPLIQEISTIGLERYPDPLKPSLHMGRNVTLDPDITTNG
ncbi:hypothetical protein Tco_0203171, partial [Tanacetum coccineum]